MAHDILPVAMFVNTHLQIGKFDTKVCENLRKNSIATYKPSSKQYFSRSGWIVFTWWKYFPPTSQVTNIRPGVVILLRKCCSCSLKIMGKKLQNELWACPDSSKLSKRWPPTLFLWADTKNGKKTYFLHFGQLFKMLQLIYRVLPCETSRPHNSQNVLVCYQLHPVRPEQRRERVFW